jgi:hypothetical protein
MYHCPSGTALIRKWSRRLGRTARVAVAVENPPARILRANTHALSGSALLPADPAGASFSRRSRSCTAVEAGVGEVLSGRGRRAGPSPAPPRSAASFLVQPGARSSRKAVAGLMTCLVGAAGDPPARSSTSPSIPASRRPGAAHRRPSGTGTIAWAMQTRAIIAQSHAHHVLEDVAVADLVRAWQARLYSCSGACSDVEIAVHFRSSVSQRLARTFSSSSGQFASTGGRIGQNAARTPAR